MTNYRVYCFDGASKIVTADWLEAVNDAEALHTARKMHDSFRIEVWDRERLAGRYQRRLGFKPRREQR